MKLNYKRTVLMGFAFLSICAFWQMYDGVVPLILTKTFHLNETLSGAIMAADNVLALFLLPFFGALSDKCTAKSGRRMPFIVWGTLAAVVLMQLLPVLDNSYYAAPGSGKLALFIALLGLLLLAMGIYRSPAVALMPDLTPKPLRSSANAVINLMGAVGGILYLLITSVLYSSKRIGALEHVNYTALFAIVGGIMLLSLLIVKLSIRERDMAAEMQAMSGNDETEDEAEADAAGGTVLSRESKKSLLFLLMSVALWYVGYNGITTWFTTYANTVWGMALGDASLCLTIATGGAIVSYIPAGIIATRVGRRVTILFGAALLALSFFAGFLYTLSFSAFSPVLYVLFICVGIAWAAINVNSLPMVVEMCRDADVGKFTGYYYTFSMAAQIITPMLAGFLLRNVSYRILFLYSAVFVALSFVTMLFVRHGDSKAVAKRNLLEYLDVDD